MCCATWKKSLNEKCDDEDVMRNVYSNWQKGNRPVVKCERIPTPKYFPKPSLLPKKLMGTTQWSSKVIYYSFLLQNNRSNLIYLNIYICIEIYETLYKKMYAWQIKKKKRKPKFFFKKWFTYAIWKQISPCFSNNYPKIMHLQLWDFDAFSLFTWYFS